MTYRPVRPACGLADLQDEIEDAEYAIDTLQLALCVSVDARARRDEVVRSWETYLRRLREQVAMEHAA